ncbi:MAG: hypothetical protein DRH57_04115 [Candidatus Cloacimonadota bacterium]|nr:MAG: hypothetical protein DRH57_04115 [Candidatus Cloacimonadota bacterium]
MKPIPVKPDSSSKNQSQVSVSIKMEIIKKAITLINTIYNEQFRIWYHNNTILFYAILIIFVIFISAISIQVFEVGSNSNIGNFVDSIWWALVTITTVGYGDIVPKTFGGRIIGIILIIIGVILVSLLTAGIASKMVESKIKKEHGLKKITLKNHFIICGWNKSGYRVLEAFSNLIKMKECSIVLVGNYTSEKINDLISMFPKLNIQYVRGDYTDEEILERANIKNAMKAIVLSSEDIDNPQQADDRSIITTTTIHYLNNNLPVIIQLQDSSNKRHIKYESDEVIIYEEYGGFVLANDALHSNIYRFLVNMLRGNEHSIEKIDIPSQFVNHSYQEMFSYIKKERNAVLLGIIREIPKITIEDILSDDSSMIDNFIKAKFRESKKNVLIDKESKITINPNDDYVIKTNDKAIILC